MTRGSILRVPGLLRLTATLLLSSTAEQFTLVVLLWFIAQQNYPGAALGALVLCNRLSAVLTAPVAGTLLDRWSPARLMLGDCVLRALLLAFIPILVSLSLLTLPSLLTIAVALGALSPVTYAGVRVAVPRLVPDEQLTSANGLLSIGDQLPMLVGPAAAGAALAVLEGLTVLLIPTVALLAAGLFVSGVSSHRRRITDDTSAAMGRSGFGIIWRTPALRALFLLSFTYFFVYGPLEPALPLYAKDVLHGGATAYGALWSAIGGGALLGLLLIRPLSRLRSGIVNAAGALGWGLALLPLAFLHDLGPAVVMLFIAGLVWAPYTAIEATVIQRLVPPERHGTVFGARRSLLVAASPVGAAFGGVLLDHVHSQTIIAASAICCVIAGLTCLASRPIRAIAVPLDRPDVAPPATAAEARPPGRAVR